MRDECDDVLVNLFECFVRGKRHFFISFNISVFRSSSTSAGFAFAVATAGSSNPRDVQACARIYIKERAENN